MEKHRRTTSLVQAAAVLGVHRNTLSGWVDQGCPVVKRADRTRGVEWEISIQDVVDWRIQKAVADAVASLQGEVGRISREEADRRRAVAQAITAEVAADEALDRVVARADAESDLAGFCVVLKTGLANASAKIAARAASLTSPTEIQEICEREMNRAFEAAQGELKQQWAENG
ncbi:Terminase small subunit (DNA packaging protein Nu1) [Microvirga sp. KLBC 81]|uniref:Terminase small subunit (DNA packaging protein Nu1) n=1 Tax=Microvirga sp. KLBC 81 TaxID=1862707 RepID=UPI000D514383|nr:Terminase small subunit (DNA packaging protein Nu1) [Microvirga sp. KLBC 81]PVE22843.1 Terminase small subunit (DNA packaging protein Nu1) [Microvirga sp. KLBC 81]